MLPLEVNVLRNINRPDGATYSQTVYVAARAWFLRLLEVNVLRSEHLIYHKNNQEPLICGVFRKIKALRFIRGVEDFSLKVWSPRGKQSRKKTLTYKHALARLELDAIVA